MYIYSTFGCLSNFQNILVVAAVVSDIFGLVQATEIDRFDIISKQTETKFLSRIVSELVLVLVSVSKWN